MIDPAKKTFLCPRCREKLSFLDGTMVKLIGTLAAETFTARTQFFLPAELGRYGAIVAGDVTIREGAKVEFSCPNSRCGAGFTAAYDSNLAEILMVDAAGAEFVVVFHKIYGRRATFVVDQRARKLVGSFGEDAPGYSATFERPLNFFGV